MIGDPAPHQGVRRIVRDGYTKLADTFGPGCFESTPGQRESLYAEWLGEVTASAMRGGRFAATLGHVASEGTENDWLGVPGATMFWSHADAQSYRRWPSESGLRVETERFVPEDNGGHTYFCAVKPPE